MLKGYGESSMDEQVVGPDLVLTTEVADDRVILSIKGELDAYTAPGLEEKIARMLANRPSGSKLPVGRLQQSVHSLSPGV